MLLTLSHTTAAATLNKFRPDNQDHTSQTFPATKVFTDRLIRRHFEVYDWMNTVALKFHHNFPEVHDAAVIKSIRSLSIHRYQPSSFQCGVTDTLAGRVVYCLGGCRLFLGMSVDKVCATFQKQFGRHPSSLRECASWLRKMHLEQILDHGFYCLLREGDVLVIPPFSVVLEGGLGVDSPCDLITWPCLLPGGFGWRTALKEFQKLSLLSTAEKSPEAKVALQISHSIVTVEKLLLLSDVKPEAGTGSPDVRRNPLLLAFTLF